MQCRECEAEAKRVNRGGFQCPECLRLLFSRPAKLSPEEKERARTLYEASKMLPEGDARVESYGLRKETIMKIIGKDGDQHFRITPETLPKIGKIVGQYLKGVSVQVISREAGMNRSTIYRTFVVWNSLTTDQRRRAVKVPRKKVRKEEVIIDDATGDRPVLQESPRERFAVWLRSIRSKR